LNQIKDQCTESDAVFPANDPLYNGTGAVIGSVGFGNQFLCYSVSDRDDVEEGQAHYRGSLAAQFRFIQTFLIPLSSISLYSITSSFTYKTFADRNKRGPG
jgi:hypothetical protein